MTTNTPWNNNSWKTDKNWQYNFDFETKRWDIEWWVKSSVVDNVVNPFWVNVLWKNPWQNGWFRLEDNYSWTSVIKLDTVRRSDNKSSIFWLDFTNWNYDNALKILRELLKEKPESFDEIIWELLETTLDENTPIDLVKFLLNLNITLRSIERINEVEITEAKIRAFFNWNNNTIINAISDGIDNMVKTPWNNTNIYNIMALIERNKDNFWAIVVLIAVLNYKIEKSWDSIQYSIILEKIWQVKSIIWIHCPSIKNNPEYLKLEENLKSAHEEMIKKAQN